MEEIAVLAGARYLTRPDHVPMPDALDALVGYFDDERMAVVQTPHDFFNHDSVPTTGRPRGSPAAALERA